MPRSTFCNANNQIIWNSTSTNISEIRSMQNSPTKSKAPNTTPFPCQVYTYKTLMYQVKILGKISLKHCVSAQTEEGKKPAVK